MLNLKTDQYKGLVKFNNYKASVKGKEKTIHFHLLSSGKEVYGMYDAVDTRVYVSWAQDDGRIYKLIINKYEWILDWSIIPDTITKCERCSGTGEYRWGTIVNGTASNKGICFHCEGKGKQNLADKVRCHNYNPKV